MDSGLLYIDCSSGVAGDMFVGALLDLGVGSAEMLEAELGRLGLEGWSISCEKVVIGAAGGGASGEAGWDRGRVGSGRDTGSERATRFAVMVERGDRLAAGPGMGGGRGRKFLEIMEIIGESGLPAKVRDDATAIYRLLAEAEAGAHGCLPEDVHFHELGMADSILDIVAACILMDELRPEKAICSPVTVGYGTVETMHGVMAVPAPATERLLERVPHVKGEVAGELATPTGVALVSRFAGGYGSMPDLRVTAEGYGAGGREIKGGGVLRMVLGY